MKERKVYDIEVRQKATQAMVEKGLTVEDAVAAGVMRDWNVIATVADKRYIPAMLVDVRTKPWLDYRITERTVRA